jgi:transposase
MRRKLKRRYVLAFFQKLQPCLVGIEACATLHHCCTHFTLKLVKERTLAFRQLLHNAIRRRNQLLRH